MKIRIVAFKVHKNYVKAIPLNDLNWNPEYKKDSPYLISNYITNLHPLTRQFETGPCTRLDFTKDFAFYLTTAPIGYDIYGFTVEVCKIGEERVIAVLKTRADEQTFEYHHNFYTYSKIPEEEDFTPDAIIEFKVI